MNIHQRAKTCFASRALLVERIQTGIWKVREAAQALGISERTVYKWLARHRQEGLDGLADRSSRPQRLPRLIEAERRAQVIALRHQKLTAVAIADALGLRRSTVSRLLRRQGLGKLRLLEPQVPVQRYERSTPGELVHIDIKKLGKIDGVGHRIHGDRRTRKRGIGWEHVHVCVDDATRLAFVEVLPTERKECATAFLLRAVRWFQQQGVAIQRVMTDNGSCYRSKDFRQACATIGAKHIRTRPYTPKTNGKAERFIQTMTRQWAHGVPYASSDQRKAALPAWLTYYNYDRPHAGIGGRSPINRLRSNLNNLLSNHT